MVAVDENHLSRCLKNLDYPQKDDWRWDEVARV
jgi:hypothetical protein